MQFVYPAFLFALAAIVIPIIIHLFHFRRYKKIIFSDLRFLKEVQEQNKSKQKLKDLLVLLARILAIIFLVLAFAQPFIPAQHSSMIKGQKAISIFIDNSFSMNNEGPEGNLLETVRYYGETNLPPNIIARLKKKYAGSDVFGVTEVTSETEVTFHITMKDEKNWYTIKSDPYANFQQTDKF